MKKYFLILFLFGSFCYGGDVEEMKQVLEDNFTASNNEDVEALLNTCSVDMPRRKEFERDCVELWKEKDIYYRLLEFEVLEIKEDYAIARIVQMTHTKDRSSSTDRQRFVRDRTGLLSLKECVEYKIAFKKDNGIWKCYLTLTEPLEVR